MRQTLAFQPGEDESVDGVADPLFVLDGGRLEAHRRDVGPVRLVLGPGGDPAFEQVFCRSVNFFFVRGGGITLDGSSQKMRLTSLLLSGSPGTMAPFLTAAVRWSRRNRALRDPASGPWQAKQFSARIGRMSRL